MVLPAITKAVSLASKFKAIAVPLTVIVWPGVSVWLPISRPEVERAIIASPSMRSSLGVGCDVVRGFVSLAWAFVMEGFVGCIKLMVNVPTSSSEAEVAKRIGVFSTVIDFPGIRVWLAISNVGTIGIGIKRMPVEF